MKAKLVLALCGAALVCVSCTEEAPPVDGPVDTGDGDGDGGAGSEVLYEDPETLQVALSSFGACMNLEVWVKSGIYRLYESATLNEGECQDCHTGGDGGAFLGDDVLDTFNKNRKFPGVMRLVTGTVDERGNFDKLVPANRYIDKGIDPCLEGEVCHPEFELTAEAQSAVLTFVEESLERWETETCNAPYLVEEE